jgi:hypothetical protein
LDPELSGSRRTARSKDLELAVVRYEGRFGRTVLRLRVGVRGDGREGKGVGLGRTDMFLDSFVCCNSEPIRCYSYHIAIRRNLLHSTMYTLPVTAYPSWLVEVEHRGLVIDTDGLLSNPRQKDTSALRGRTSDPAWPETIPPTAQCNYHCTTP